MALFNQSSKAVSAAVQEIADTAGASADTEMQNRAFRSLNASIEFMNARAPWDFLVTEANPSGVVAPYSIGVTAASGQVSATALAGHGVQPDDLLVGQGFNAGTRVTATGASSIGFTINTLSDFGTGSGFNVNIIRDCYPLPPDFRQVYSLRLYSVQNTLRPIRRRYYDRNIGVNEFAPGTPVGYDFSRTAERGKLRLLPPPVAPDVMQLRYYRRMTVATASSDGAALDIVQDYEPYMLAWAKWHFLTDKADGREQQAQVWFAFATDGFKRMLSDQTNVQDEDLQFIPGAYSYVPSFGPNSVRTDWDGNW